MAIESRQTYLPPDVPRHIIGGPTNNRWGTLDTPGVAVSWVQSIQEAIGRENLNAWAILADESSEPSISAIRSKHLQALDKLPHLAPLFLLTQETQTKVEELVTERTEIDVDIVHAILNSKGYANQRIKLDSLLGGLVIATQPIDFLSIDDDIIIPAWARQVNEEHLPRGIRRLENSQVLFSYQGDEDDSDWFDLEINRVAPMFSDLGLTVAQVRETMPDFKVTPHLHDTMQTALDAALRDGFAQFQVVAPSGEKPLPDAERARIIAVQAIKSRKPDITAANQVKTHLLQEFPPEEQTIYAYPSGPAVKYGVGSADSNIDSGTFARRLDTQTIFWPWWFVSDRNISLRNPTTIVTGQYRADNDNLTRILKRIFKKSNRQIKVIYEGGVTTQFLHNRVSAGYRQGMLEQATASAVGKLPAYEAMDRLVIDHTGMITIEPIAEDYQIPRERAQRVFDLLYSLAGICTYKIQELEGRKRFVEDPKADDKIREYYRIIHKIYLKLAELNQEEFFKHLDIEVRDQLKYYTRVVAAMPKVIESVSQIIREGKYPVVEVYKRS